MFRLGTRQWVGVGLTLLALVLSSGCEREPSDPPPPAAPQAAADGFQFLGVHAGTRIDDGTRRWLRERLGAEAAARKSPLDLTFGQTDIFERNFPDLMALHRDLNHPPNERVEHGVLKLQYRHVPSNQPFQEVTLFFDDQGGRPLLFRIRSRKQDTQVVEALESRYGSPQTLAGSGRIDHFLIWRRPGQALIVSAERDRKGWMAYRTAIYFISHLQTLKVDEGPGPGWPGGPSPF